jgi:hypothetical protein
MLDYLGFAIPAFLAPWVAAWTCRRLDDLFPGRRP